jgi:hypothetical protein
MRWKMRREKLILMLALVVLAMPLISYGEWFLDVEGGWVWCTKNDVRVPGDVGTPFSLVDDLSIESKFAFRLRLGYQFHPRHSLSVLYAPLSLNAEGRVDKDIFFNGVTFPANSPLQALYKFNSYRLTYRFELVSSQKWQVGIGLSAKMRDAEIRVEDPTQSSSKTDKGFVPLIHFRVKWAFSEKMGLLLEGDAAASPGGQGRAEDVLLALLYNPSRNVAIKFGYRILEGGADVEEAYNFTLLHYLVGGVIISF